MSLNSHATWKRHLLTEVVGLIENERYPAAVERLHKALSRAPQDPDFLYPLSTCQRKLHELDAALGTLARLDELRPNFAATFLERGRTLVALQKPEEALASFERCVRINPAYVGGWVGILEVSTAKANPELRQEAREQAGYLKSLDQQLVLVLRTLYDSETLKAEQLCRSYLKKNPKSVEAMRILARIGTQLGILDDAEFILESACEFEPDNFSARLEYIDVLHKRQNYEKSLEQSERLLHSQPTNQLFRLSHANQLLAIGQVDNALKIYGEILSRKGANPLARPRLFLTRGHAFKTVGNVDKAIADYRTAYEKRTDFGDAYWSLANLKTYRFTQEELGQMHRLVESSQTPVEDRVHFCFALGKAYEDAEDYKVSYPFYEQGNQLNKQRLRYNSEEMTKRLRLQEEVFTSEFLSSRRGFGCDYPDPIFIVGLPRAGSTLLEQILASHSLVEGTLELHHIGAYAQKMDGRRKRNDPPRYPLVLRDLRPELARELGQRYVLETSIHRTDKPFFIDKMPNNFRHIGMIDLILPNAKIIDARRHPLSCCFSCYKQLFASGQEFTYGQVEIAKYYNDYCRLMEHWDSVLPDKVLRVHYEDVVADLEQQVRRILDHCGLPFEESCLRYYETERSIRTPSAEQVRQPIYREGLEQWRNFEPWLDPMIETLGSSLSTYPIPSGLS